MKCTLINYISRVYAADPKLTPLTSHEEIHEQKIIVLFVVFWFQCCRPYHEVPSSGDNQSKKTRPSRAKTVQDHPTRQTGAQTEEGYCQYELDWKEQVEWFNSLWPSDAIWRQRSGSTLAQVMACCLTAPSHYLNQCWLIITEIQRHSPERKFMRDVPTINR